MTRFISCAHFLCRMSKRMAATIATYLAGSAMAVALAAGTVDLSRKLDAPLNLFASQPDVAAKMYAERIRFAPESLEKSTAVAKLDVLIRLHEPFDAESAAAALRAAGATVHSQLGPIVTAELQCLRYAGWPSSDK